MATKAIDEYMKLVAQDYSKRRWVSRVGQGVRGLVKPDRGNPGEI